MCVCRLINCRSSIARYRSFEWITPTETCAEVRRRVARCIAHCELKKVEFLVREATLLVAGKIERKFLKTLRPARNKRPKGGPVSDCRDLVGACRRRQGVVARLPAFFCYGCRFAVLLRFLLHPLDSSAFAKCLQIAATVSNQSIAEQRVRVCVSERYTFSGRNYP